MPAGHIRTERVTPLTFMMRKYIINNPTQLTHQLLGLAYDLMGVEGRKYAPLPCPHVIASVPVVILFFLHI